jgi:putative tryptophan/tyrosine transport system substrate-binding protein
MRYAMKRAAVPSILVVVVLLALCASAKAQQPKKVPLIGFLTTEARETNDPRIEAFWQGLRELGYVEGKNIDIEYRYADGKSEQLPELAGELVQRKVDILVVQNDRIARAAKKLTVTIPIVMASSGNLSGLVTSLARPGGNVTGLTSYTAELLGKRLELLKEVVPKVSRFAFLNDTDSTASKAMFDDSQGAAKALGVTFQLIQVEASNPNIESAFRVMVKERIGALITSPVPLITFHIKGFWS